MSRRHSQSNTNHASQGHLGSGERFDSLSHKLAERGGVTNPDALAAVIGRKKYGAKRMANWAAKGRKG